MTEEEMKKKVCPDLLLNATLTIIAIGAKEDQIKEIMTTSLCMGSDCAKWVWDYCQNKIRPNGAMSINTQVSDTHGKCGLINN